MIPFPAVISDIEIGWFRLMILELRLLIFDSAGASGNNGQSPLQYKFTNSPLKWPSNFEDYTDDWTEFEIGVGKFAILAFNERGANEVLFVKWSH